MKILQESFAAEIPRISDHLLPVPFARLASNCDCFKGDLRALAAPSKEAAIALTACKSLFKHAENGNSHWVVSANECSFIKSPVSGDAYERVYFTGETEPRFFANDNVTGTGFVQTDFYKLGIPAPTVAPTVATTSGGATFRGYVYAWVNSYGDEGPPSPVGSDDDYASGNVAISAIAAAPADRAVEWVRLYRTNASAAGTAEFQFVLDATYFDVAVDYVVGDYVIYSNVLYKCTTIHPHGAWNAGHFTAGDDVTDADLLAVYPKTSFDPPPSSLKGLSIMACGSAVGFDGNVLYFAEPFFPHAYPTDYQIPVDFQIEGIAVWKNIVVVAGPGRPYVFYGTHPAAISRIRAEETLPLFDARGICAGNGGVFFVSRHGLIWTDGTGFTNATESLMDSADWSGYNPTTLAIYWYDGKLYGFDSVGADGFFIDFSGQTRSFVPLGQYAHAGHIADDGAFYVVVDDVALVDENDPPANMPLCVSEWEGSDLNFLLYTYQSKEYVSNTPINLAAALIVLEDSWYDTVEGAADLTAANAAVFAAGLTGALGTDGPLGGGHELGGDEMATIESYNTSPDVIFKLYVDGVLRATRSVSASKNLFKLPRKYVGERVYFELSGYVPVKKVSIATSVDEL